MTDKKVGGIYAIEDEGLKRGMLEILEEGVPCMSVNDFIKIIAKDARSDVRFLVLPMVGGYDFDLENDHGSASAVDAIQDYIDLLLSGFSFYVWDRKLNRTYYTEQNEYIYKPLDDRLNASRKSSPPRMPCPEVPEDDKELLQLLQEAHETLREQAVLLEYEAQYEDNEEDLKKVLDKAAHATDLAGRCKRMIYEMRLRASTD